MKWQITWCNEQKEVTVYNFLMGKTAGGLDSYWQKKVAWALLANH